MKLVLLLCASCAISPRALPADHPANASAPTGRLAGAPAELRPGVVVYEGLPALRAEPPAHHHHR